MNRETPDGAGYRARITQHDDHAHIEIQRETQPDTWTTIQTWDDPTSTAAMDARERRLHAIDTARPHGWALPSDWPRRHKGTTTLTTIDPLDWLTIVTEATNQRDAYIAGFTALDQAWQQTLIAALDLGQAPSAKVATAGRIARSRVYQLKAAQADPAGDSTKAFHAAVAQQRTKTTTAPATKSASTKSTPTRTTSTEKADA